MRTIRGKKQEGFSLVEMIIAVAIVGLVMSGVVLLISYSTSSMRRTSNTVNLQNQAKDAVMHMTTYMQEASDVSWDSTNKALITVKKKTDGLGTVKSLDVGYYWVRPKTTTGIDSLLFVKDVVDFDVKFVKRSSIVVASAGPESSPEASPEPSAVASPAGDVEAQYVVCFYKKSISTNVNNYLNADGSVAFDKLSIDYSDFSSLSDESESESPSATPETSPGVSVAPAATVDPGLPVASTAPAPAPVVRRVGGNSAVITLRLRNDNGDADFTCVKEVFFRNQ